MFFKRFQFSLLILAAVLVCSFSKPVVAAIASSHFDANPSVIAQDAPEAEEFVLPPLPYEYSALEPNIDLETMTIHHDRHHAGYVQNLNEAIALYPELKGQTVQSLLLNLESMPEDIKNTVRNSGGGHANHTMFWSIMTPYSGEPSGEIGNAINATFGDFETFKSQFNDAGKSVFGSGWVWLVTNGDGSLEIATTPNQDSPLMEGKYPIMGNDVWEHAYYLKYQNKRGDYLDNWWNVVNWEAVNERFELASSDSSWKK